MMDGAVGQTLKQRTGFRAHTARMAARHAAQSHRRQRSWESVWDWRRARDRLLEKRKRSFGLKTLIAGRNAGKLHAAPVRLASPPTLCGPVGWLAVAGASP